MFASPNQTQVDPAPPELRTEESWMENPLPVVQLVRGSGNWTPVVSQTVDRTVVAEVNIAVVRGIRAYPVPTVVTSVAVEGRVAVERVVLWMARK